MGRNIFTPHKTPCVIAYYKYNLLKSFKILVLKHFVSFELILYTALTFSQVMFQWDVFGHLPYSLDRALPQVTLICSRS